MDVENETVTSNEINDHHINKVKIWSPNKLLPTEYVILMSGWSHPRQGIIEKLQNITINNGYGKKTPYAGIKTTMMYGDDMIS